MSAGYTTYRNVKRLHLWLAVSSLALLAVTAWMVLADHRRQWKQYQRAFREQVDAPSRPLAPEQIWLPELTQDYNFRQVARFDRCTTCHQGIDSTEIPRGLPQPYASHPRLDLFVGPDSPHPMAEFGCTICHEGQGSATDFTWASHTPNDPAQRARWRRQYGWSPNPHWDFPMLPARFAQSRCLKCHHDVVDLEPSRRFPDPPAEKLLAGYHLVRQYGCFGCHELSGFDATGMRIGPDMRVEAASFSRRVHAAAAPAWKGTVPFSLQKRGQSPEGALRKVGPSLRGIAGKLDAAFLVQWIGNPAGFRPATRMPRLFGMHEHLDGRALADARRFEPVEVQAVAAYLLAAEKPADPLPAPAGVNEPPSVERGKRLFQLHGCLACHKHRDFPQGEATQAADLSNFGAKLTTDAGAQWLASWIRDPSHHSPRTLMPNPLLEPIRLTSEAKDSDPAKPRMTDPAADIAAYLLAPTGESQRQTPGDVDQHSQLPLERQVNASDLDALALLYLRKSFPEEQAAGYLKQGIPTSLADQVPADAAVLIGRATPAKKLLYVGRRTIARRGCFGCHDIPGFEDAQPIGPALSDWGRKQESLLAFEQVHQFVEETAKEAAGASLRSAPATHAAPATRRLAAAGTAAPDAAQGFFLDALRARRRKGFLWQKLRAPRSFDFQQAQNKPYTEQLTMGRFELSPPEREAIITFVLGLVAQPPADRYVYRPDARERASVEGRKVLDKYACAQCHTLQMDRWTFEFDQDRFPPPPAVAEHDFLKPQASPEQIAASKQTDPRGWGRAEVVGMPRLDTAGKLIEDEDDDGKPVHFFTLWEPALINGQVWLVGGAELTIPKARLVAQRPPLGGSLARLLYPVAIAEARAAGSNATEVEAWGWVPPSLAYEGAMVQPAWLHDYLLNPKIVRPAALLRMPRYNLSSAEAGKLVDYFAAAAGVDFPYTAPARPTPSLAELQRQRPGRLDQAMRLLVDRKTYCAKCHLIGDFSPSSETWTILAPSIDEVARRVRPEYIRRWLASPKSVLPYTAMPAHFPPTGEPLGQDLFPGSSIEQLDAVEDLLLHYDEYLRGRTSIRQLMQER